MRRIGVWWSLRGGGPSVICPVHPTPGFYPRERKHLDVNGHSNVTLRAQAQNLPAAWAQARMDPSVAGPPGPGPVGARDPDALERGCTPGPCRVRGDGRRRRPAVRFHLVEFWKLWADPRRWGFPGVRGHKDTPPPRPGNTADPWPPGAGAQGRLEGPYRGAGSCGGEPFSRSVPRVQRWFGRPVARDGPAPRAL